MEPYKFFLAIEGTDDQRGYKRNQMMELAKDASAVLFDGSISDESAIKEALICIRNLSDYAEQSITLRNAEGKIITITAVKSRD